MLVVLPFTSEPALGASAFVPSSCRPRKDPMVDPGRRGVEAGCFSCTNHEEGERPEHCLNTSLSRELTTAPDFNVIAQAILRQRGRARRTCRIVQCFLNHTPQPNGFVNQVSTFVLFTSTCG